MKHINTGLCYIYLDEYSRVVIEPLMRYLLYKGLNRDVMVLTKEEAAHFYPWK